MSSGQEFQVKLDADFVMTTKIYPGVSIRPKALYTLNVPSFVLIADIKPCMQDSKYCSSRAITEKARVAIILDCVGNQKPKTRNDAVSSNHSMGAVDGGNGWGCGGGSSIGWIPVY